MNYRTTIFAAVAIAFGLATAHAQPASVSPELAKIIGCAFVIDLPELGGADKIRALGKDVTTLVNFEGH